MIPAPVLRGGVSLTPTKTRQAGLRPIPTVGLLRRQPRPERERAMSALHRRRVLHLLAAWPIAPCPALAQADACRRLLPGLSLCDAPGWTPRPARDEASVTLVSTHGIEATVQLSLGLTPEEVSGARWMISHMPISARARVMYTGLADIDGQPGATVAYLPRHADPAIVVTLSDVIGTDYTLVVSSSETGVDSYTEIHQQDHAALLAALRLDTAR